MINVKRCAVYDDYISMDTIVPKDSNMKLPQTYNNIEIRYNFQLTLVPV